MITILCIMELELVNISSTSKFSPSKAIVTFLKKPFNFLCATSHQKNPVSQFRLPTPIWPTTLLYTHDPTFNSGAGRDGETSMYMALYFYICLNDLIKLLISSNASYNTRNYPPTHLRLPIDLIKVASVIATPIS